MTVNDLIRALENIKFRNPNADVQILDKTGAILSFSPVHFGEANEQGIVINPAIDPLEVYNQSRPLHTLLLYGQVVKEEMGF